jgi:hypothetical protein
MFRNETSEEVALLLEARHEDFAKDIGQEVRRVVEEQGKPVWTRVGIRVKNNEIQVQVISAKEKPSSCRSFSAGFVEHPWVLHA